jgi:ectoine hydroxylase-related dioxygenase (phytanoyl-CoA dioxygenase family)
LGLLFTIAQIKAQFEKDGFTIIEQVYDDSEIAHILSILEAINTSAPSFRKTKDLFAIRRFFQEVPQAVEPIFTDRIKKFIHAIMGEGFFVVKSIYFDKPQDSNWFVAFHQDLTISVAEKKEVPGFGPWTAKQGYYAAQPPLDLLQDNFTIRIHLDDTTADNGALKVIPQSHTKGIYRPETIDFSAEGITTCTIQKGGIMLMKPLLMHASGRTTDGNRRRVIHIECSKSELPSELSWAEQLFLQ